MNDFFQIPDKTPVTKGHNLSLVSDLKPRDLSRSIMAVYRELGGDSWLLTQAKENPKEFMAILKTIVPKNLDINMESEIIIKIEAKQESNIIEGQVNKFSSLEVDPKPISPDYSGH